MNKQNRKTHKDKEQTGSFQGGAGGVQKQEK